MILPPDPAEWTRLSHEQLYAQVQAGPGTAAALAAQDLWTGAGEVLDSGHARITSALVASGEGWTGTAADAARGGLAPLTAWASAAVEDARVTVAAVVAQGDHAERLRTLMPPPNTADVQAAQAAVDAAPPRFGPVTQMARLTATQAEAQGRADDAFRLMRGYADSSDRNVVDLDRWSVPPAVTVDATPVGPASTGRPVQASRVVGARMGVSAGTAPITTAGGGEPTAVTTTGPAGIAVPSAGAGSAGAGQAGVAPAGVGPAAGRTDPGVPPSTAGAATLLPGYGGRGSRPVASGVDGRSSAGGTAANGTEPWRTVSGSVPQTVGRPVVSTGEPGATARRPAAGAAWADEPQPGRPGVGAGTGDPYRSGGSGSPGGRPGVIGSDGLGGEAGTRNPRPGALGYGTDAGSASRWPGATGSGGGEVRNTARWAAEPVSGSPVPEPATTGRGTTANSHTGLYPPMMGGGMTGQDDRHRRPDWLVDDSGAFEDHRWFPPAVIGPDDPLPPPTESSG